MDDISVLQHRCLLNLERSIRDFGQDHPAEERCLRLQKDGDTLRSAGWDPPTIRMGLWGSTWSEVDFGVFLLLVFFFFFLLFYIFIKEMDTASL